MATARRAGREISVSRSGALIKGGRRGAAPADWHFNAADGELVAVVPTSAYGDVQSILETGVPIAGSLARTTLSLVLVATTDA